jgi:hypothetical protein
VLESAWDRHELVELEQMLGEPVTLSSRNGRTLINHSRVWEKEMLRELKSISLPRISVWGQRSHAFM